MKSDIVYVCSPLSAPTKGQRDANMKRANEMSEKISKILRMRAIAPHGFVPAYLDDSIPEEREIGLRFGLDILRISKAIIVCGDIISIGMAAEIKYAEKNGIPVYHYTENGALSIIEDEGGAQIWQIFKEKKQNCRENSMC